MPSRRWSNRWRRGSSTSRPTPSARPRPITTVRRSAGPSASTSRAGAATRQSFHAMVRRLATYQRCVILSGDVHFSSGIALDFWSGRGPDGRLAGRAAHVVAGAQQRGRGHPRRRSSPPASPSSCCAACPSNGSAGPRSRRSSFRPGQADLAGPPQPDEGQSGGRAGRGLAGRDHDPCRQAAGLPLPPDAAARHDRPRSQLDASGAPATTVAGVRRRRSAAHLSRGRRPPRRAGARPDRAAALARVPVEPRGGPVRGRGPEPRRSSHELYSMDGPDSTEGGAYTIHRASLALSPELVGP